jgi:hypothetical protein
VAPGDRVDIVVEDVSTNGVVLELSSSEPELIFILCAPKTILDTNLKMCSLKNAVCAL